MRTKLVWIGDLRYSDPVTAEVLEDVGISFDPETGRKQVNDTTDLFLIEVLPSSFRASRPPLGVTVCLYPAGSFPEGATAEQLQQIQPLASGGAVPVAPGALSITVSGLEAGARYSAAILADFED